MLERTANGSTLLDHELLEIILFNPIPRKNTNETAHRLLQTFGSLNGVLSAAEEELELVEGVGKSTAQYLKSVYELFLRLSAQQKPAPRASSFGTFAAFLEERFHDLSQEAIDLFCLDGKDRIKHTARFTSGEASRAELPLDEVGSVLLAQRPNSVVVAHNHPGTTSRPSEQDDAFTAQLQLLCSINRIKLRDHIIVGADGMYSYFAQGRLEEIEHTFSVENIIGKKNIP